MLPSQCVYRSIHIFDYHNGFVPRPRVCLPSARGSAVYVKLAPRATGFTRIGAEIGGDRTCHVCFIRWKAIIDHLLTHEKTMFKDLMSKYYSQ